METLHLPLLHIRLTYRLLEAARVPAFKGTMLRGGFGYAFQRSTCPSSCWGRAAQCPQAVICPYRWVFETPRPAGVAEVHDLNDIPRPFVVDLPNDQRTFIEAGETLEFRLVIVGNAITYLPFFVFGFATLGEMGLGVDRAKAQLERVAALEPWSHNGPVLFADGVMNSAVQPPIIDTATIVRAASELPEDLRITIHTPLRIKSGGAFMSHLELPALIRALCWRFKVLSLFHSDSAWHYDLHQLLRLADQVRVEREATRWENLYRTSNHRGSDEQISLSGLVGTAILHNVAPELRALLLLGGFTNVGKSAVFGAGKYTLKEAG